MLINKVDSNGNALPLGGEFPLEENEHFNKLPVSTQMSNIQVPTNVYNRGTQNTKSWTLLKIIALKSKIPHLAVVLELLFASAVRCSSKDDSDVFFRNGLFP